MRIAAIDIGTNSVHMIVVRVRTDLSFEVIDREKAMVRLGAGGLDGKALTSDAMGAALQAHGRSVRNPDLQVASLDHTLWLHRDCRIDDWLLYAIDSPIAYGARAFARGSIFTKDGKLAASVAQEGLVRVRAGR